MLKSNEMVEVSGLRDVIVKQAYDSRATKKFTFDRAFGMDSKQVSFLTGSFKFLFLNK